MNKFGSPAIWTVRNTDVGNLTSGHHPQASSSGSGFRESLITGFSFKPFPVGLRVSLFNCPWLCSVYTYRSPSLIPRPGGLPFCLAWVKPHGGTVLAPEGRGKNLAPLYSYVCSLSSVPSQIFEAYSFRKWNRIVIRIKHSVTNDLKIMCIDNIRWSKFYFMNEYFSVCICC